MRRPKLVLPSCLVALLVFPACGDGSDGSRPPTPSITVIAPNGGESFIVGDDVTVQWSTTGSVGNVDIDLYIGGGWTTLASDIPNSGSSIVTLPGTTGSDGLMRVAEVDGNPADESDAPFSIDIITPVDSPVLPARGYYLGVLPSPAQGQDFASAYLQASNDAEWFPVWGRPSAFWEMAGDYAGAWGQTFIETYGRGNGMFPLIHMSFIDAGMTLRRPPGMGTATLSTPEWRDAYKQAALDIVAVTRPKYLSLGNEVNRWYEAHGAGPSDPNGFQHFASLYEEIYDAVKMRSPDTIVFCVFAREIVSQNQEADLSVIFPFFDPARMDMVVYTSYVYAVAGINTVSQVPDDYYSASIPPAFASKPFGFSEVCWASLTAFGGEQGQSDFLSEAVTRLTVNQGLDLHLVGWPWLHDLDANDEAGLIEHDGTPKIAYTTWQNL